MGAGVAVNSGTRPRVVTVVGNPKAASRTTRVAAAVAARLGATSDDTIIELAGLASGLFDYGDVRVQAAVDAVLAADRLVVASPTYKATYTGLLKAFLDRFGAGSLNDLPTVPVMVAATPRHALAVNVHLCPVLLELSASLPGPSVFVLESELDQLEAVIDAWWQRARTWRRLCAVDRPRDGGVP